MEHPRLTTVIATCLILTCGITLSVQAVSCWARREEATKTCGLMVSENVTKEDCCSNNGDSISWSPVEEVSSEDIFKYEIMNGGVPDCNLCEKSCEQKTCPAGRKCIMKKDRPRCVCKPNCSQNNSTHKGPVCGSNGKQYKSKCALLKAKCRQQDEYFELDVAYNGHCQNSCDSVQCLGDKCCEVDQHGRPHCVSYSALKCPAPFRDEFVCGEDGVSYETLCQLRRTSCASGMVIEVAYDGKCDNVTSCNDTTCVSHKQCYWDQPYNTSRCILCNYTCIGWADKVPLCGSDGNTYDSFCDMQNYICQTETYVELVNWGGCDPDGPSYTISDPGSGYQPWGYDSIDFTPSIQVLHELQSSMSRDQESEAGDESDTNDTAATTMHTTLYSLLTGTTVPTSTAASQIDTP